METTLFTAMSANGMIASTEGREDFLSQVNWETLSELVHTCGNCIVGRKTHETVNAWDEPYGFDDFTDAVRIVLSTDRNYKLKEAYTLAHSPEDALALLKERGFTRALVSGGATVNSAFVKAGLIDRIIINVEATIVGNGVPIFAPDDFMFTMQYKGSKNITENITQLEYMIR